MKMKMFTVSEIIEAYEFDIEMLREDKKNSNRSKLIQRDKLMLQFLATLPEDMKISAEAIRRSGGSFYSGSLLSAAVWAVSSMSASGGSPEANRCPKQPAIAAAATRPSNGMTICR